MDLHGERQRVAGLLEVAGITAELNPEAVNPPCVVIGLPAMEPLNDQMALIRTPVYVVAPGPATADAVAAMLDSLGAVTTALGDPSTEPGLAGLPAANASGYTVTAVRRAARAICLDNGG